MDLNREALAEQAREWVRRTCEEQGLPVKVTEPTVIAQVVDVLSTATADLRTSKRAARAPDRSG
jgi:hypothetical protein